MQFNYSYLLQEREFINSNQNVYTIGKTKQENSKRFNQYPKGSKLFLQIECKDSDLMENQLLILFRKKYTCRNDIGNEYFEGDVENMMYDMFELRKIINNSNEEVKKNIEEIKELDIKLKELKKEEQLLSLKEKLLKTEKKIALKQLFLKSDVVEQNELHHTNIHDEFKEWFDKNCKLNYYGKIPLEKMVNESQIDKTKIRLIMKQMGYKYNKDLRSLGKDKNGKYYKGGFEGITFI
jgi:hypothetical protein